MLFENLMRCFFFAFSFVWVVTPLRAQEKSVPDTSVFRVHGDTIDLPRLSVGLTPLGLPKQLRADTTDLLAENMHFHLTRLSDGKDIRLKDEGVRFVRRFPPEINKLSPQKEWEARSVCDEFRLMMDGTEGVHGNFDLAIEIYVLKDIALKDLTFHIPMEKDAAKYMSGMGIPPGLRPDSVSWMYGDQHGHPARAWIGNEQGGIKFELASSFGESGKGGVSVAVKGRSMLVNLYSGPVDLKKGDILTYRFLFSVTHDLPNDVHLPDNQ